MQTHEFLHMWKRIEEYSEMRGPPPTTAELKVHAGG